jgi:phosphoribosylformylglycinamidine synthase
MEEGAKSGLICSAHDVSEGGLAIALFEMGMKNNIGADVILPAKGRADAMLFGEAPMMVLEVATDKIKEFTALCNKHGQKIQDIGVTGGTDIKVRCGGTQILNAELPKGAVIYEKVIPELVR